MINPGSSFSSVTRLRSRSGISRTTYIEHDEFLESLTCFAHVLHLPILIRITLPHDLCRYYTQPVCKPPRLYLLSSHCTVVPHSIQKKKKKKKRYLGFFFTPTLDWSYHIQFYTNKAFSSVRACAMLGNSIRGIGPKQRSLAYQGCVLPIITYGSALWYAPGGVGVSRHIRRMDRVHSFALNWITGTFRTTPLGARGIIAGIPPLRIILDLRFHGLRARLTTLGDYHIVHSSRSQRWINLRIANIRPRARPRHLPNDNPLTRLTTDEVREQFLPFHTTARPGTRLLDVFTDRIIIDTSPKKNTTLFKAWLQDLAKSISSLHSSGRHVIYTNGAYWNKSARGAHSFTAFHGGTWQDFSGWCPAGSSFDSEIVAIETAIQWACIQQLPDPVFFVDNKAALTTFTDTRVRSSQTSCIRISEIIQDYLSSCESTITFHYCPSHSGIEGNERADRLTKRGAAIAPLSPPRILLSNFINDHIVDYLRC